MFLLDEKTTTLLYSFPVTSAFGIGLLIHKMRPYKSTGMRQSEYSSQCLIFPNVHSNTINTTT